MKILLIGPPSFPVNIKDIDDFSTTDAFGMLLIELKKSFQKLGIEVFSSPVINITKDLPEVDFVLLIIYEGDTNQENIKIMREKTKCKYVISIRETPDKLSDISFVFIDSFESERNFLIHLPANKKLLLPTQKIPKTILIDHYWEYYLNTDKDWTYNIEKWVENLIDDNYIFYRMIRWKDEEKSIKSFEIPINRCSYLEYLDKTNFIETYIITHQESYAYGVIDMACRGSRVCSPPNFLKKCITDRLNIPIFKNESELNTILKRPIENYWEYSNSKCTDYDNIAIMINEKIKKL
jgi:hypothetical protein